MHSWQFQGARKRILIGLVVLLAFWLAYKLLYPLAFQWYVGESNPRLHYATSQEVSPEQFESIAAALDQGGAPSQGRGVGL